MTVWDKWPRMFPPYTDDDPQFIGDLRHILLLWKSENTPIINEALKKAEKYEIAKKSLQASVDLLNTYHDKLRFEREKLEAIEEIAYNRGYLEKERIKQILSILEGEPTGITPVQQFEGRKEDEG